MATQHGLVGEFWSDVAIEYEGTPVTEKPTINFTGAGVSVSAGTGKATVDIPGTVTSAAWVADANTAVTLTEANAINGSSPQRIDLTSSSAVVVTLPESDSSEASLQWVIKRSGGQVTFTTIGAAVIEPAGSHSIDYVGGVATVSRALTDNEYTVGANYLAFAPLTGLNLRRVLALGSSITGKWTDTGASAKTRRTAANSYLTWFQTALMGHIETIIAKGVSGDNTTEMLARWSADVAANYDSFDTLILEIGPNCYSDGLSAATVQTNITTMVASALAASKGVLLLTPTVSETWTNAQNAVAQEVRQWILNTYRAYTGVYVVDASAISSNPLTGLPFSDFYVPVSIEATRVHPSMSGASAIGRAMAEQVPTSAKVLQRRSTGQRDRYELLANPRLQGGNASGARNFYLTGTNVSGTGPDSCALGISGTGFTSVVIAPLTADGSIATRNSGGVRITVTNAAAARDMVKFRCGTSDAGVGGTQYGRLDQDWAATTAYTFGEHRRLTASPLGLLTCITAGTTGGSAPSAPASYGMTVTDGTVTWLWTERPKAGDVYVAELEYEIESVTGGMGMYTIAELVRTIDTSGERWGFAEGAWFDAGATLPDGSPSIWMPRRGRIVSLPITLEDPAVTMRHAYVEARMVFAAGGSATVVLSEMSLRRIA